MQARPRLPSDDLDLVLRQTPEFWQSFRDARLFVTGGTGFLGLWMLEVIQHANRELGANIEVLVLSRNPDRARGHAAHIFSDPRFSLLAGDVTDPISHPGHMDICLHAATDVADVKKVSDWRGMFHATVDGTRNVLDLASRCGASRFLLTSSGAVYGRQPADLERIPESYAGAPDTLDVRTAYGQGKRAAEWLAGAVAAEGGMQVSIARIFALVGPGIPLEGPFALGNFVRDVLAGRDIAIDGDGRSVRSYLYMADACWWLLKIFQQGESGRAYNVGAELPVSIAELAGRVRSVSGLDVDIDIKGKVTAAPTTRYVPDTTAARTALDLSEMTDFDSALRKTIDWYRGWQGHE